LHCLIGFCFALIGLGGFAAAFVPGLLAYNLLRLGIGEFHQQSGREMSQTGFGSDDDRAGDADLHGNLRAIKKPEAVRIGQRKNPVRHRAKFSACKNFLS
jgi:hypothetical protein